MTKEYENIKKLSKNVKSKKREQKKLLEEKFFKTFDWNKTLVLCFDIESDDFKKMFDIINYARSQNRGIKADSKYYNVHHIIPRSYFKKYKYPIDNREINLVKLTLQEHFMVHYHAWKCATSIKRQMATAFHLMVGRAVTGLQNAPLESIESLSELIIPLEKKKSSKSNIEQNKIKELTKIYGNNNYTFVDENHIKFKCSCCGKISVRKYDSTSRNLNQCGFCVLSNIKKEKTHEVKYPREGIILCVCILKNKKAFWELIPYKSSSPMINNCDIQRIIEQEIKYYNRMFFVKVFENEGKEQLIDYFNNRFGKERNYSVYVKDTICG